MSTNDKHWLVRDAEKMPLQIGWYSVEERIRCQFIGALHQLKSQRNMPGKLRSTLSDVWRLLDAEQAAQDAIALRRDAERTAVNPHSSRPSRRRGSTP